LRNLLGDVNVLFDEIALRDFPPESSPYLLIIAQIAEKVNSRGDFDFTFLINFVIIKTTITKEKKC
jgi:hypothetical protein